MATTKQAVKVLQRNWDRLSSDLFRLNARIIALEQKKATVLTKLDGLLKTFNVLGEKPTSIGIPELIVSPKASLGDAIEQLLVEYGSLTKSALKDMLQQSGRLSSKNARVILANSLTRDARKRFIVANGKVRLKDKKPNSGNG